MRIHAEARGILRHQHMFPDALVRQSADLVQHALHVAGAEPAADERNGAVGAPVVAPVGDAHIGCVRRGGKHALAAQHTRVRRAVAGPLARQRLLDGAGQHGILAHAQHQVNLRHILQNGLLIALRQAAGGRQELEVSFLLIARQR